MKGETYKKLKEYEGIMQVAANCGYVRMTRPQTEEFSALYEEVYGKPMTRQQKTCGRCLQKAVVGVWTEYQKYKSSPWGKKIDGVENADKQTAES